MKKNIGEINGLYPTPVTIVGVIDKERVNWINIAHIGIIGHDLMLLSMHKSHYSNQLIKKEGKLSINLVNEDMLEVADFVGLVSARQHDKSDVFKYVLGTKTGAPLIVASPLSMECEVIDIFDTGNHDNFIVRSLATHVEETCLNSQGRIDYEQIRPVLFEMPNRQYLSIGKKLGSCWNLGKNYVVNKLEEQ